jgi:carbon-monoxide dehydrogenase iron sulfur subunit
MVTVEAAGEYGVPMQCRHCEEALCIEICPTGAVRRQNELSPVVVDADLCIGCKLCLLTCPFGVLKIGKQDRAIIKCDMCYEGLKEGKMPQCVEACPTRALQLVGLDELTRAKRRRAAKELTGKTRRKAKG